MDRNARSIVPPMNHAKPRNGPISPRERDVNNSSYQPPHYNNYNNSNQNHSISSSPNNQQAQSPNNSDLINFVSGAWKEKMSSEVFKSENNAEKLNHFDLDGWFRTRQN